MSYKTMYRKWRPTTFDDVVGQESVIQTLKSQILNNSISHSYLFSGTRGTGKTSTAKILSRAVNCLNRDGANPCNSCEICSSIFDEKLMDIIEIDAASNNGVDDVREIRENVKYPPSNAKYKVYIIDEVHMLSTGAFNALLKTLEEPPEYVIFILATTEPHKIPATILSRCQTFEFKRVSKKASTVRLIHVLEQMNVQYEEEAIDLIIQNSDGALRDALSMLDKCIDLNDNSLTVANVTESMGLIMDDVLFEFCDALIHREVNRVFNVINELNSSGKDINQFVKRVIFHFRNGMLIQIGSDTNIINESTQYIERAKTQFESVSVTTLIRWINVVSQLENELKWTSNARILLEVAIAKLIYPIYDVSYETLIERLDKLEQSIEFGNYKSVEIKRESSQQSGVQIQKIPEKEQVQHNKQEQSIEQTQEINIEKEQTKSKNENVEILTQEPKAFDDISKNWQKILSIINNRETRLYAFVLEGIPKKIEDGTLLIGFDDGLALYVDMLSRASNKAILESVISEYIKSPIKVKCVFNSEFSDDIEEQSVDSADEIDMIKQFVGEDINIEICE